LLENDRPRVGAALLDEKVTGVKFKAAWVKAKVYKRRGRAGNYLAGGKQISPEKESAQLASKLVTEKLATLDCHAHILALLFALAVCVWKHELVDDVLGGEGAVGYSEL